MIDDDDDGGGDAPAVDDVDVAAVVVLTGGLFPMNLANQDCHRPILLHDDVVAGAAAVG